MATYQELTGMVIGINNLSVGPYQETGCYKLVSLDMGYGTIVNFVVAPNTYFVDNVVVGVDDRVSGFYTTNEASPHIYPPSHNARVVSKYRSDRIVKVDYFDNQLVSSDGLLKINIGPNTKIILQNGQPFTGSLTNRELIVVYGESTRSLPAQTTPSQIVVLCS
ncbi:hypothetical protein FITA111629_09840 [Filibacter tadaridae]|uniref:Uncharacterized protein n=1 Tax=Filibacter tadaridae TaxID=2483811 RepID=A0A3P5XMM3_9BACL|nr:hypothetical protein [Filibacter tadaridae]VDC32042.1 hypothetical protein FILTAD_02569 [Filibacter tadaridae]